AVSQRQGEWGSGVLPEVQPETRILGGRIHEHDRGFPVPAVGDLGDYFRTFRDAGEHVYRGISPAVRSDPESGQGNAGGKHRGATSARNIGNVSEDFGIMRSRWNAKCLDFGNGLPGFIRQVHRNLRSLIVGIRERHTDSESCAVKWKIKLLADHGV